jgi:eukaryotic-like serine/threonine-protein kinase
MTIRGPYLVWGLATVVLGVAAGLIWYKRQPELRTLPFTLATDTGTMYLVPAGAFRHGPGQGQEAVVPPFYIDQTEVTNEAFARFAAATGRSLPPEFPTDRPRDPVANVTIVDATEFCRWAGKRLPDSIEWEKAARGTRGDPFPWGSDPDPRRANVLDNPERAGGGLMPANSMPQNPSPSRALHMGGNVAEFVRTTAPPDPAWSGPAPPANEPWYFVRGGSYRRPLSDAVVWSAIAVPARHRSPDIGFRCAKTP